jgi:hypothetical protein
VQQFLELTVSRRGLDPVAWTALHALREMQLPSEPVALARADLWDFELPPRAEARTLIEWATSANWFANPSRDLAHWRRRPADEDRLARSAVRADGGVGESGEGAYLVVSWIDSLAAPAHERAARRGLGHDVVVRHGHIWWLATAGAPAGACLEAVIGGSQGGLLMNPNSQRARIHLRALPMPALFAQSAEVQAG